MRKLKLMALSGVVLGMIAVEKCWSAAGEASSRTDAGVASPRGIARIDPETGTYLYWYRDNPSATWYPIFGCHSRGYNDGANLTSMSLGSGYYKWAKEKLGGRTFNIDVIEAITDETRFNHALATDRYFDAWSMGGESEQGRMWKEMAAAGAKKKCKELGMESVLLEASDPRESRALAEKAGSIFTSFPEGNPLREELRAQFELGKRLATPPAVPVAAALEAHRSVVARLLED